MSYRLFPAWTFFTWPENGWEVALSVGLAVAECRGRQTSHETAAPLGTMQAPSVCGNHGGAGLQDVRQCTVHLGVGGRRLFHRA